MLLPKRTKFRRLHRGRLKGVSKANKIVFGEFGIQALEPIWLTSRQIEATNGTSHQYCIQWLRKEISQRIQHKSFVRK